MSYSRSSSVWNSDRSRWKLTEQTMIRVRINLVQRTQCNNMTSITQQESLIRAKPGHRIHLTLEKQMTFSSRPSHRRTMRKDWENKCIVARKQHRGVHIDMLHQPQNTNSLRDTRDNSTHMVLEDETPVKLHAKNVKVGTSANGTPRQEQVTMGRVDSPGLTNYRSLSFVRIQYHAQEIAPLLNPSQVPVKGGSNSRSVCWLANNCQ